MDEYLEYGRKASCLNEIKAWNKGESETLEDLIGVGFYKHFFICEDGNISFFYSYAEWKKFHKKLREILTNDFFDKVCGDYIVLISKIKFVSSKRDIDNLSTKLWAIQSIFNEIDDRPKIANEYILDKLLEIRTATHTKHYELERKRKRSRNEPKNYIYFKGKLYIEEN